MNALPATTYPEIVGRLIAGLRDRAGLNQEAFAKRIGLTQPTLSRIERGESALSIGQLARIGAVLGVSPSEIMRKTDEVATEMGARGIRVLPDKLPNPDNSGMVLVGMAALVGVIALVLGRSN